ncbi:MAG TPA: EF-hand domain-containing protein [Sphingomonas sp.]|nr:EF-hand domain-containing protein [Sphingomonas sp.]
MLKQVLFAAVVAASASVVQAQDAAQTPPAQPAPAEPSQDSATPPGAVTPDQQVAQPAPAGDDVAQAVEQEFPTYDTNGDGTLDQTEFTAWMTELRAVSDPAVAAGSSDMAAWGTQAFATADTDKDAVLSKSELIAFLSQGAS